jgi:hypothetical protein
MDSASISDSVSSSVSRVDLALGAEENGLATMLADLVRQNLQAKPHKKNDFDALDGRVAIVADDADVSLTIVFSLGRATIHDGIVGIPDVTIRGTSDTILALSNMPLSTPLALPFPDPRDKTAVETVRTVVKAMRSGAFRVYGMAFNMPFLLRLTRVMSING